MSKNKNKSKNKKFNIKQKLSEMVSELKKVTYPTLAKTAKQTGIVISLVLFFALVLFGLDWVLSQLYELLISGIN